MTAIVRRSEPLRLNTEEKAAVRAMIRWWDSTQPSFYLEGPPGSGKTRALAGLVAALGDIGVAVLQVTYDEFIRTRLEAIKRADIIAIDECPPRIRLEAFPELRGKRMIFAGALGLRSVGTANFTMRGGRG